MTMTNTAARTARTVALGVVSEGTHVTEDLLCAFAYAMRDVTPESDALANEIFDALAADPDNELRLRVVAGFRIRRDGLHRTAGLAFRRA